MIRSVTGAAAAALGLALAAPRADAQGREVTLSAYTLMYTGFGTVWDPPSASRWVFADAALGGGGGVHVALGRDVVVGADAAFSRTRYERRPRTGSTVLASGNATVSTLLAGGRISGGAFGLPGIPGVPAPRGGGARRGEGLGTYLAASIGALGYALEDLDGTTFDLAFAAGGGLEYVWSRGQTAFIEWKRLWVFHEREGVDSGTTNHSRIELGARVPVAR
jgi:hypothetical protein